MLKIRTQINKRVRGGYRVGKKLVKLINIYVWISIHGY